MADLTTFYPFPRLPIELRLKIFLAALPQRLVEPEIDCDASLIFGEHNRGGLQKPRHIPEIFTVNSEARNLCLEQYVPFAGTYVHRTQDVLLFSTDDEKKFWLHSPSFYHITDHPLEKLKAVAIEVTYDGLDLDFSGHLHWIRGLGCPQELIICAAPSLRETRSRLLAHYQHISGTSRITSSDGNRSQLVKYPHDIDREMVQQIKPKLMQALREEKISRPEFRIPEVDSELYFVSDPDLVGWLGNMSLF